MQNGIRAVLRGVQDGDLPVIAAVHHDAVTIAYADLFSCEVPTLSVDDLVAEWAREAGDPANTVVVAELAGQVVGMVVARVDPDPTGIGERPLTVESGGRT